MYFIKGISYTNLLDGHASYNRIKEGGFTTFLDGVYKDEKGVWVLNTKLGKTFEEYSKEGELCEDGLLWFNPLKKVKLEELVKSKPLGGIDVSVSGGFYISIPNALSGSNQFKLSKRKMSDKIGNPLNEYGKLALELYSLLNSKTEDGKEVSLEYDDPRISRLIVLALQGNFYVTEEVVDYLEFIGVNDINNIITACWGIESDSKKK
jgi:hypothetical protein